MANRTLEMSVKLRGELEKSYPESIRRAAAEAQKLQEKLTKMKGVDATAQKLQKMKESLKGIAAESGTTSSAYTRQLEAVQKLEAELRQAGFATEVFANSQHLLKNQIESTEDAMRKADKVVQKYKQHQYDKNEARKTTTDKQQALFNATGNLQSAQSVATSIMSPFTGAVEEAMKFESAMADVKKVVDFDTPKQFDEMYQDILQLSGVLPMTAEEIAAIVAAGGQSGIAREDLKSFAEAAAKMGIAFDISADQAGDMMAKWRTAFKMSQPEVVALADKVNLLGNTTAASAPLISDVLSRIGPLGEVGGFASGEIAAMGASMISAGVQSDVAATGLKNMMLAMVSGESATKAQKAAFSELGMDAVDLAKRMQTDASGAVIDLMKNLQGLDKYKQASVLQNLFGKESIGPITTLLNNLPALEENLRKVGDASQYTGSMEAEFAARNETTENQLMLLQNRAKAAAKAVGNTFLPMIKQAAEWVANNSQGLLTWLQEHQEMVKMAGVAAAAIAGLTLAVFGAAVAFAGFGFVAAQLHEIKVAWEGISVAAKMAGVASRIAGLSMSLFSLPVIAGIAAIIAVMAILYANWDKVKETAEIVWNHVSGTISAQVERIKAAFGSALDRILEVWNSLTGETVSRAEWITGVINNVGFAIGAAFDIAAGVVGTVVSVIFNIIASMVQFIGGVVNIIVGIFTGDWERIWKGAGQAVTGFVEGTFGTVGKFIHGIGDMFDTVMGKADEVEKRAKEAQAAVDAGGDGATAAIASSSSEDFLQLAAAADEASGSTQLMADNLADTAANAQQTSDIMGQLQGLMQNMPTDTQSAFANMGEQSGTAVQAVQTNFGQLPQISAMNTDLMAAEFGKLAEKSQPGGEAFIQAANTWGEGAYSNVADWSVRMAETVTEKLMTAWNQISTQFSAGLNVHVNATGAGVAHNATGGIYKKGAFLTTFAEESPEAAIPLDGSRNAISLWQKAGEMLGVIPREQPSASINMPQTVLPDINVGVPAIANSVTATIPDIGVNMPSGMAGIVEMASPVGAPLLQPFVNNVIETAKPVINLSSMGTDIAQNAEGGIYKRGAFLTTFAEKSPEAAIPLDGSSRAIGLWQRAGEMLGILPETSEAARAGGIMSNISFNGLQPMTDILPKVKSEEGKLDGLGKLGEIFVKLPSLQPEIMAQVGNILPNINLDSIKPIMNILPGSNAERSPFDGLGKLFDIFPGAQSEGVKSVLEISRETETNPPSVFSRPAASEGGITSIEINMPAITINGNADAGAINQIEGLLAKFKDDVLKEMSRQFPAMKANHDNYERRLSYG